MIYLIVVGLIVAACLAVIIYEDAHRGRP